MLYLKIIITFLENDMCALILKVARICIYIFFKKGVNNFEKEQKNNYWLGVQFLHRFIVIMYMLLKVAQERRQERHI